MENKEIEAKGFWDYMYEADNDKDKFKPVSHRIVLSLNDKYETELEYGYIGWMYSDVDRAVNLEYDYENDTHEFTNYVCGRFGIKTPKNNYDYQFNHKEYEEYELFKILISGFGLKNGLSDLIQFFMIMFYDTSERTFEILKKYHFRIEYA